MPLHVSSGNKLLTFSVATGGGICRIKVTFDMYPVIIIAIMDPLQCIILYLYTIIDRVAIMKLSE